ncbi:putative intracellular protein transport protein [Erysiphe neolycopersici]|uniref:Putative intracellular protein transport protein n=1 Tax=Erysiphe neolycopersici TaxID=212602 RepID=A0A420I6N0_9PEZI|nr:putative intracellular protein transport protein [Erysiphe neolycopersici]
MSVGSGDIRVLVDWIESTIFAGEELKCNIIIRNVSVDTAQRKASVHSNSNLSNGPETTDNYQRTLTPRANFLSQFNRPSVKGHRPTHSSNSPNISKTQNCKRQSSIVSTKSSGERGPHKRSVSIISIGASEKEYEQGYTVSNLIERSRKDQKGHVRSASLQNTSPKQAIFNQRQLTHTSSSLSPRFRKSPTYYNSARDLKYQAKSIESSPKICTQASQVSSSDFTGLFTLPFKSSTKIENNSDVNPSEIRFDGLSKRNRNTFPHIPRQVSPSNVVPSPTNSASISCGSGEIYINEISPETISFSKSSTALQDQQKSLPSNLSLIRSQKPSEILMMGYAQLHGSFTLDSSLVDQAPFDEVKKKGVIGGQGGGVVGVELNKRDSGLLRSFGWATIGGISDLLGSNELSSIKEFREIISSRSIPVLATPQSIIFVDLHLNPGESKCFNYSFKLPHGLPPSHRGKAIKIMYKLVIGIQRPGGTNQQQVKLIEVPFRVLGSVDNGGKTLCHDLKSPYVILQDQACIKSLPENHSNHTPLDKKSRSSESRLNMFMSYTDKLLSKSRNQISSYNLSPSDVLGSHSPLFFEEPNSVKEAIDMAILRSNNATETQKSPNRFEIARSGKKVAVIMLIRPAFRLGETINVVIDFTDAIIPCYAINASLESSERVDTSISLRSEASILHSTRKIYVTHSESTLFSERTIFSPTIPTSATPEFITSGVSLDWRIRVEFITPILDHGNDIVQIYPNLLDEVSIDDRGLSLKATETIDCDSFQIAIPIKVYGIHSAVEGNLASENWYAV